MHLPAAPAVLWLLLSAAAIAPAHAEPADVASTVIAVVVSADRAAESLDLDDVELIFKRKRQFWGDGQRIQPVNLPPEHPLRQRFTRSVLHLSPELQQDYWNEQYFQGVRPPHMLRSEDAVVRFLLETAGAIGYLPYCGLDPRLHAVLLIAANGRSLSATQRPSCT